MNKHLKDEVNWAKETLNPKGTLLTLLNKHDVTTGILHPDTQLESLSRIKFYRGSCGKKARQKAVEDACLIACNALDYFITKEDILYKELSAKLGTSEAIMFLSRVDEKTEKRLKGE